MPCLAAKLLATGDQVSLLVEKAKVLADELLRDSDAETAIRAALSLQDDSEDAQDALSDLEGLRDNWQKVVKKHLDDAKASTARQLTTELYTKVGELYAKYSPGSGEGEGYWFKALSVEPRNRRASQHLERLMRVSKRWPDLIKVYEQRADNAATKEERIAALLGLADLYIKELNNPGGCRRSAQESAEHRSGERAGASGADQAVQRAKRLELADQAARAGAESQAAHRGRAADAARDRSPVLA